MKKLLASTILATTILTGIAAHAALPYTFATQTGNTPASYLDSNFTAVSNMGVTQCTASGTNSIALTPLTNQGTVAAYQNYQEFLFVGSSTSTGAVSVSVNSLSSLPLYLADGATQAGANSIVSSAINVIAYNSALNSGGGGFQLISQFPIAFSGSTGTGSIVLSNSPTLTGTISAVAANFSGAVHLNANSFTQTGTTLSIGGALDVNDNSTGFRLFNISDSTKQAIFSIGNNTTNTTRLYTFPDANGTIPIVAASGIQAADASSVIHARTIVGSGSGDITVTNGNGVSGNPTLSLTAPLEDLSDVGITSVVNGVPLINSSALWQNSNGVSTNHYIVIAPNATDSTDTGLNALGSNTNINLSLNPKGNGAVTAPGYSSVGTKFTASGCSNSATVGGASAGQFASGTTGTCTATITLGGASGLSSANGWSCWANDITTGTSGKQTASSTTTATISVATTSGDTVSFGCLGY